MIRRLCIKLLIRFLEREFSAIPQQQLTKDVEDGMLSQLWQSPAFRKYIADRDAKLIYTMAGGEGMEPEPRDKYLMHAGQRVENLLLARASKLAFDRKTKKLQESQVE